NEEPAEVILSSAAIVTDIIRLRDRKQMDALDREHIWTPPLIDMRFNYRPQNPLYLLILRVFRLREPITIQNTSEYAGCKSWVPLTEEFTTDGSQAVTPDDAYEHRRQLIQQILAEKA